MVADYHIHTRASPDAEGSMADCVQAAKKRRIEEIGFSEHVLLRPLKGRSDRFIQQMPAYVHDFVEFKERSSVPVKLGTEIDFFPDDVCKIKEFIQKYPRGLRRPCQEIYPSEQFLRILHKHGIPITFGSDAHAPENVGRSFKKATRLAKRVGYSHTCVFDRRERVSVRI